jgi:hypothetical protein
MLLPARSDRFPRLALVSALLFAAVVFAGKLRAGEAARILVQPDRLELTGADPEHGLLVTLIDPAGRRADVTRKATFTSTAPQVVAVEGSTGKCRATRDGEAEVEVAFAGHRARVPVHVAGLAASVAPSFRQDILPLLTRTGCNMGGCHGKLAGQNGFRLSLRGYAPEWDHDWLTREVNGRRVDFAFPEASLLVQKPTGDLPHEGGTRFKVGSRAHRTLVSWIAARAPGPVAEEKDAARLEVLPGDRVMRPGETQQLLVRAHYADGRMRDVTWLAQFFSNDEATVAVKPEGMVRALRAGETSVRVHFQGCVEVVRLTMPFATEVAGADFASRGNALDEPIFRKLEALRIPPSPPCDDATFLRRAYLDAAGILPTPEELAAFVADPRPDRRARAVDALLERPEWLDFWTLQLADLLQNRKERDHDVRGAKGVRAFHAWLRGELAAGRSWAGIARAVLLAKGDTISQPQAAYYVTVIGEKQRNEESELPDSVAQSFLGTRIGCARCHNHPLERYTQDDFYRFSAFFSRVSLKRVKPESGATELTLSTREEAEAFKRITEQEAKLAEAKKAVEAADDAGKEKAAKTVAEREKKLEETRKQLADLRAKEPAVNQPRTNQRLTPRTLDQTPWQHVPGGDAREQFVEWALGSDLFAGAMVNRLWKHFFNVGLVEPVDDLRASNPPSNGELWTLLTREFAGHGFDLKHLMRLILNSRAYALSSETVAGNETDAKFYSHYFARRLPAEVLLDAIAAATGTPAKFDGYPLGLRAAQLPEPHTGSYFLTLFGRSDRVTACACERKGEVTLPQLLHLQNGDEMQRQIQDAGGRLASLLRSGDDRAVTDGLFLATLARRPSEAEAAAAMKALEGEKREEVFRDLFWALMNSKEFTFNH